MGGFVEAGRFPDLTPPSKTRTLFVLHSPSLPPTPVPLSLPLSLSSPPSLLFSFRFCRSLFTSLYTDSLSRCLVSVNLCLSLCATTFDVGGGGGKSGPWGMGKT